METEGISYLLNSAQESVLDILLAETNSFTKVSVHKIKSIGALRLFINKCNCSLDTYYDKILNALYRNIDSDELDGRIREETLKAAEDVGLCVDQDILVPTLIRHINEIDSNRSALHNRLEVFALSLAKLVSVSPENCNLVLSCLESLDLFNSAEASAQIFKFHFSILHNLMVNLDKGVSEICSKFFISFLFLQAIPETADIHSEVAAAMQQLAVQAGHSDTDSLYSEQLESLLAKFSSTSKEWSKSTPDRFAFDTLIRYGGTALMEHWKEILEIINNCCSGKKDLELRMDMMILLENLIDDETTAEQLSLLGFYLVEEIVLPQTAWMANIPNHKVRKAALVCMTKMVKNKVIDEEYCMSQLNQFIAALQTTLDDDRDPDLRFLSAIFLNSLIDLTKDSLTSEELNSLYPLLVGRLDDSQDKIRVKVCTGLVHFFSAFTKRPLSQSIFAYIADILLIHLDDTNQEVRSAVGAVLNKAAECEHREKLLSMAREKSGLFTHQMEIINLINHLNSF